MLFQTFFGGQPPPTSAVRCCRVFIACAVLVVIGFVAFSAKRWYCDQAYALVSPVARCAAPGALPFARAYEEFSASLSDWIEQQKQAGVVDDVAVYFRDMQNGPWFGIHADDTFFSASLFKVPVMIAFLKEAERDPLLMSQQLSADALPEMSTDTQDPDRTIVAGRYYAPDELLTRMIRYSDNQSMDLLTKRLNALDEHHEIAKALYYDLGLLPAEDAQTVSVRTYASLFRILYNARYLSPENSQKALALLASSDFNRALVAGVPDGVKVAHKFGVHNMEGNRLFHDCGIIYHPERPYLLCIMTRGKDIEASVAFIAEVSRRVYAQVTQNIVRSW